MHLESLSRSDSNLVKTQLKNQRILLSKNGVYLDFTEILEIGVMGTEASHLLSATTCQALC